MARLRDGGARAGGRTYRFYDITPVLEDKAFGKRPHDIRNSRCKNGRLPAHATLHTRFAHYPCMIAPYLTSLDFCM